MFWARLFALSFCLLPSFAQALDVILVTPQGARTLKTWSESELKLLSQKGGEISAQKLIIDESTKSVDLNDRADIDLVTLYGAKGQIARVPRFLVWRGNLKLKLGSQGLTSSGETGRLLVPSTLFKLEGIHKIELSRASTIYPGTSLVLRTNPAASRGEKLYTQSCLACHAIQPYSKLPFEKLTPEALAKFNTEHKQYALTLDAKATRGLLAYRDALASEKTQVK